MWTKGTRLGNWDRALDEMLHSPGTEFIDDAEMLYRVTCLRTIEKYNPINGEWEIFDPTKYPSFDPSGTFYKAVEVEECDERFQDRLKKAKKIVEEKIGSIPTSAKSEIREITRVMFDLIEHVSRIKK